MNSEQILELDRRHVWHPCTQQKDLETLPPIPIERGDGVWLTAVDGRRFIDGVSSWWVNLFGHNHPRLNRALNDQAEKIAHTIFAGFTHQPAVELASRLCALAPSGLERVFYTDNGSAAVEAALKMSFQYWQQTGQPQKTRFLSLSDAYHGETLGALSVGGCDLYREIYQPLLLDGYQARGPDCFRCPYGQQRDSCQVECFALLETIARANADQIAAIIIEPLVQGAAGMRIYPPLYLQRLRALCDELAIHYIADEIAVGFGRTGKLFANQHAGVSPDMLCLSKGITGGYMPLAAVLTTDTIYQAFYDDYVTMKAFLHSHSYTGNPLACALAVEVLNIFEQELILEQLPATMAVFEQFRPRFEAHPQVGELRRCGMIAAVELVENKNGNIPYPWQQRRGLEVYKHALDRGALLRPLGNVIYFMPPLTITPAELATLLEIALESIDVATRA